MRAELQSVFRDVLGLAFCRDYWYLACFSIGQYKAFLPDSVADSGVVSQQNSLCCMCENSCFEVQSAVAKADVQAWPLLVTGDTKSMIIVGNSACLAYRADCHVWNALGWLSCRQKTFVSCHPLSADQQCASGMDLKNRASKEKRVESVNLVYICHLQCWKDLCL